MYENTKVNVNITIGNIPLTIAQDAPQFNYSTQLSNQNDSSNGQFPTNYSQLIGLNEPTPVPGFAQQVPPYGPPPSTSLPYPQQSMIPAQNTTTPYVPPSLYPQTQMYNQSQLPYPDVNVQQPGFSLSFQNSNPEGTTPTAPPF